MYSNKKTAHIAGLVYLVVVLSGMFSLMYVPSILIVSDDPTTTFNNIAASEPLFRLGIASGLVCYTFFLILPLVLYKLLSFVDKSHAILMVVFAVVSVPISFMNMGNYFSVLSLVSGAGYLDVFDLKQLQSEVMLLLESYNHGNTIAQIFWGLWLFPFGYLVFKSKILPKVLGIFLMLGCIGYLLDFLGQVLIPNYYDMGVSSYITLPASIGEIGICLWLLIAGAKNKTFKIPPFVSENS